MKNTMKQVLVHTYSAMSSEPSNPYTSKAWNWAKMGLVSREASEETNAIFDQWQS